MKVSIGNRVREVSFPTSLADSETASSNSTKSSDRSAFRNIRGQAIREMESVTTFSFRAITSMAKSNGCNPRNYFVTLVDTLIALMKIAAIALWSVRNVKCRPNRNTLKASQAFTTASSSRSYVE